jgi:competence protein ComEC
MIAAIPERIPRAPRESVAVSLAATLATAPCTALHFGQIAPVGIVANLAAIPITGIAVPAIALALAVSTVSLPLGRFLAGGADLLLGAIDHTARAAAALPGGHLNVPRDAVLGWALALLLAAAVGRWGEARHRQLRPLVRRASAATAAFALLTLWPLAAARWSQGALEIHAIDVGQGDALAIRSPGGRWILVDAGPGGQDYDAGRARVVPFLLSRGVRRLDALILTHPDADHFGGAASVLEAFDVGAIVDPGMAAGKPFFRDLVRGARHRELRWIAARAGKEIQLDDLALVVLAPEERRLLDERAGTNEVSVAFRLEYGRFRALFLGDAPAAVEEELVEKEGAALRADVLKVAHHGSKTSTSEALLAAAEPRVAIISVGRRNRFGHPAPAVLERLNRHDVQILRTDREGTISLSVRPDGGIVVKTQR